MGTFLTFIDLLQSRVYNTFIDSMLRGTIMNYNITADSNIRIWNGEYQIFTRGEKQVRPISPEERKILLKRAFGIIK